jgi:hypothetical protein
MEKEMPKKNEYRVAIADEQTIILIWGEVPILEVQASVAEQTVTVSFLSSRGGCSNPIMLSVDTKLLGYTEDDDSDK